MDQKISPREVASKFADRIKEAVMIKYSSVMQDLSIMDEGEFGSYYSKVEENVFCCFVVGNKNGYLYQVRAKIKHDSSLEDYFCEIIP